MTDFDLLHLPLDGVQLIEAGAGTGKTYSIEGLFLRLILEAGLTVDQILVLTFTVAATAELRERIRRRLSTLRRALAGSAVDDASAAAIARRAPDPRGALRTVDEALLDFDRAAIYTIHGFCQRLLTEYAFETGSLFDTALAADPGPMVEEVSSDFWRRHLTEAPPELAAHFFAQQMTGPARLAALYGKLQRPGAMAICGARSRPPGLSLLDPFRRRFADLKRRWPRDRDSVAAALMTPALKNPSYGSPEGTSPGAEISPRQAKVETLCRSMDRYLDEESLGFPTFSEFHRFTAEGLAKATRKGASVPEHPFFDACSALFQAESGLRDEMDRYLLWFKSAFVAAAPDLLADEKHRKNVLFYDDLLLRTREALRQKRGLARAAENRYRAALVDEFQDTDPVQYEIFKGLFRHKDRALFMIGDPKQAIYGFRGADVFSYLSAAADADIRHSLLDNWRSAPSLIRGVNALFSGVDRPFLLDGIDFAPARPALSPGEEQEDGALEIWRVAGREDGRPLPKGEASGLLIGRVVDEIDRLLSAGRPAGQIAVLVRTNRQARDVKSALTARRIPAVLYSAGSVFQSEAAEQLHYLLLGIAEPADPGRVRAALTTDLIGVPAVELAAGESDPDWWSRRAAPLAEDNRTWRHSGFIRMFQALMERERIRGRMLARTGGERRLTDLLHLVELCHCAAAEGNLGPSGLLKWLAARRESAAAAAADEEQLRLESDALAVQVVTVHRSKGLEFPVVFVPFGWESSAGRPGPELLFHDPDAGYRLTLDLGGGDRKRSERLVRNEALAEDLRLLYVALTRAKERCYLAWGRINPVETSPLTYLFHGAGAAAESDPAAALARAVKGLSDFEFFAPLNRLAATAGGSIAVLPLDSAPPAAGAGQKRTESAKPLSARVFSGRIDRSWRVASYSMLAAGHRETEEGETPDRDRIGGGDARPAPAAPKAPAMDDILDFPGGARAGTFFHEVMEKIPFGAGGAGERRALVARFLNRYRYDRRWQEAVFCGIERVLSTPLSADDPDLVLSAVPRTLRLHETAFFFPLKRVDARTLASLLPEGAPLSGGLRFSPVQGYLKGYIDLIFRHRGRYFLVDWKSNRLGERPSDYDPGALSRVMGEANYSLQYALYCLALDLYLRNRDPGYTYDAGFGGVFYLFIRGMRPERGPELGVYFDRPEAAAIARLRQVLVAV